jgi:hypothetical protein
MDTKTNWARPTDRLLPRAIELLDVDTASGICRWKHNKGGARAGAIAGTVRPDAYTRIRVDGVAIYAHRIVMYAATGTPPPFNIDHESRTKDARGAVFNGIANLRDGGDGINHANHESRRDNSTGWPGVVRRRGKYQATISRGGKWVTLGTYASPLVAWIRYVGAKLTNHPHTARCDLPGRLEAARDAVE